MNSLNEDSLREVFARAHIDAADVSRGIGQQLTYRTNPHRTIVIHLV